MRALRYAAIVISVAFTTPAISQATTTYQYDTLGRLSTATYSSKNITYNFDPAGNRTQVATQTNTPHGALKETASKSKKPRRKKR